MMNVFRWVYKERDWAFPLAVIAMYSIIFVGNAESSMFDKMVAVIASIAVSSLVYFVSRVVFRKWWSRKGLKYRERMEPSNTKSWSVMINGVTAGEISDGHYAAIEMYTLQSWRIHLAQLCNIGRTIINSVYSFLVWMPVIIFWFAVAMALAHPESLSDIANYFQTASVSEISGTVGKFLWTGVLFWLLSLGFCIAMAGKYRYGFKNCYAEARAKAICQHIETPVVDGSVVLIRDREEGVESSDVRIEKV